MCAAWCLSISFHSIHSCSLVLLAYLKAFEELEDLLAKHNICIAVKEKLVKDSGVAEEIAYDNIVLKLLTKPRARGKYRAPVSNTSRMQICT